MRVFEEAAGEGDGEADMGDGEIREVLRAMGEEFLEPDTEEDAGGPGSGWVGRSRGDGGGDEAEDIGGVVVVLNVQEHPDVLVAGLGKVVQEVGEARHGFVGRFQRSLFLHVVPGTVFDGSAVAEASFHG